MKLISLDFSTLLPQRFPLRPLVVACLGISMTACGFNDEGHDSVGSAEVSPPLAPTLSMSLGTGKQLTFSWDDVAGETEYRLLEKASATAEYSQIATIAADATSHAITAFLPTLVNANYMLQACNEGGCSDSPTEQVSGTLTDSAVYIKASNTGASDSFGYVIAISEDGGTLAVGAYNESSAATGINGEQDDDTAPESGAVYVFTRSGSTWSQQAYVKSSNPGNHFNFSCSLDLSSDGNTMAVGAYGESTTEDESGAVYTFTRSGTTWSQQAVLKASTPGYQGNFGWSLALSADGNTLAVGEIGDASNAQGIDGDEDDESAYRSGAAYVFTRSGSTWSQQAYIKASNSEGAYVTDFGFAGDSFGATIDLSADGNTLAVGAPFESSNASGVNGDEDDNSALGRGAAYMFSRSGATWTQEAYLKPSSPASQMFFGAAMGLSADGNRLAVGGIY